MFGGSVEYDKPEKPNKAEKKFPSRDMYYHDIIMCVTEKGISSAPK